MLGKLQNWLNNQSDVLAQKHNIKQNKLLDDEDTGLHLLDIPLIGGFIYLFYSYDRAVKVVRENKMEQKIKQNARIVIKEHNKLKSNIERQINDILLNTSVSVITVPPEHMTEFMEVIKEMDIGIQQLEKYKFMLTAKEGVVL